MTEARVNYGEYLKVPELLKLQHCLSNPPHHDELQFIIIHQAYELWFKLILHELDAAYEFMCDARIPSVREATHHFRRVTQIQRLLLQQIHILETMRPIDFLRFREPLKPASGFQSTQFREIEFFAGLRIPKLLELCTGEPQMVARAKKRFEGPTLWDGFCQVTKKNQIKDLVTLYQSPEKYPEIYELAECLVEFDENLQLWREHHVRMVERMIGDKPGTGASVNQGMEGTRYLRSTLVKNCFPELWSVRSQIEL